MQPYDIADMIDNQLLHGNDVEKWDAFPIDFKDDCKSLAVIFAGTSTDPSLVKAAVDLVMEDVSRSWEHRHNYMNKLQPV